MRRPERAEFDPRHRRMLEHWAAEGCEVSAYMLKHSMYFPEALEALLDEKQKARGGKPAPVPEEAE